MSNNPKPPSILVDDDVQLAGLKIHVHLTKEVASLIESGNPADREKARDLLKNMEVHFGAISSVTDWLDQQQE